MNNIDKIINDKQMMESEIKNIISKFAADHSDFIVGIDIDLNFHTSPMSKRRKLISSSVNVELKI